MTAPHSGHGDSDGHPVGALMKHGPGHDMLSNLLFGGRRRRVFSRLAALSGARPGNRVLDVGCGTGYFTRVMAETVAPDGTAEGVDPSPEGIARARRITKLGNCTFSDGAGQSLDAPDGTYDVVVSSLAIHHLPEALRPQAVGEMFRVLRPGGRVLIAEFRPPATRLGRALMGRHMSPAMHHNPVHLLEPMARQAGFEQVDSGDVRPWIRYVRGVKPTTAP